MFLSVMGKTFTVMGKTLTVMGKTFTVMGKTFTVMGKTFTVLGKFVSCVETFLSGLGYMFFLKADTVLLQFLQQGLVYFFMNRDLYPC
jgi:hypothetical protein